MNKFFSYPYHITRHHFPSRVVAPELLSTNQSTTVLTLNQAISIIIKPNPTVVKMSLAFFLEPAVPLIYSRPAQAKIRPRISWLDQLLGWTA